MLNTVSIIMPAFPLNPPKTTSNQPARKSQNALNSLLLLSPVSRLLSHLLLPRNSSLDPDPAKDEPDAQPLHLRETVPEGDDGQDHGEHLPRHRHGNQQHGRKGREGIDYIR